jgi:hypothetical protein
MDLGYDAIVSMNDELSRILVGMDIPRKIELLESGRDLLVQSESEKAAFTLLMEVTKMMWLKYELCEKLFATSMEELRDMASGLMSISAMGHDLQEKFDTLVSIIAECGIGIEWFEQEAEPLQAMLQKINEQDNPTFAEFIQIHMLTNEFFLCNAMLVTIVAMDYRGRIPASDIVTAYAQSASKILNHLATSNTPDDLLARIMSMANIASSFIESTKALAADQDTDAQREGKLRVRNVVDHMLGCSGRLTELLDEYRAALDLLSARLKELAQSHLP